MQNRRSVGATFAQQRPLNQVFSMRSGLILMDFPGDDFAAVDVHDQVEVPVLASRLGWDITDIPVSQLVRAVRCKTLGQLMRRCGSITASALHLLMLMLFKDPVEGRYRGHIESLICQQRYDLRRWQALIR